MKRVTMDFNADRAHKRATAMEHYEEFENLDEAYEDLTESEHANFEREYFDDLEHLGRRKAAGNLKRRHGRKGGAWLSRLGSQGSRGGNKSSTKTLTGGMPGGTQATFTIIATRMSFNIASALPIELFNQLDNYSDNAVLRRYLPAGVTLVSSNTDATRTNWIFVFANAAGAQDRVIVSCAELSFNKLQLATSTDVMRIGEILYKISDEVQQTQFSTNYIVVDQTMFGKGGENPLTLSSFINPKDYRKDTIRIPVAYDIDKQTGIIMSIVNVPGAGANYTFSVTIAAKVTLFNQWTKGALNR